MSFYDGGQQLPGATPPPHPHHPQDLQEAETSHRGGNRIGFVLDAKDHQGRHHHHDICDKKKDRDKIIKKRIKRLTYMQDVWVTDTMSKM